VKTFSTKSRTELLHQLNRLSFDVLVIGGGITGSGIALDAASRGLNVILIEMQDFGAGTSSRSTKLIHGGLRYLKQFEFKLVGEVGKERQIIHRNAPHLVRPELMLLPIFKKGSLGKFSTRVAMWAYEFLTGMKSEERHQFLNVNKVGNREPLLNKEDLLGGILYYEYSTDDARLVISVLKEAVSRGARAINYLKVTGFIYEHGKIKGVKTEDQLDAGAYTIHAKYVINASGPWVDELDCLDNTAQGNKLQLTKGVHLVVDHQKLPVKQSVYFDTYDKRMIFVIPHGRKTYIGTTDTFYSGDKQDPLIAAEDKTYLLKCVNDYFKGCLLKLSDIESGWAGIRPLIKKNGKKPSEISRKDEIFNWKSGLITIAGGKLTGYRKMAQRVVDLVAEKIAIAEQRKLPVCSTHKVFLSGGNIGIQAFSLFLENKVKEGLVLGLSEEESSALVRRYGSEIDALYTIIKELKEDPDPILPLSLRAELLYVINNEMCLSPSDFFIRRTGMLYFEIDSVEKYAVPLVTYMQGILKYDESLKARYDKEIQEAILNAR
jgi:glycerol-3-phosphate dehydrogenase